MKKLLAGIVAMVGVAAFADAANTLVYFYSEGPDTYADGTTVLDGERYALVWSQDGEFDGFTVTGEAVNQDPTKEKVFGIVSRARGGRCPMTVFQIDSKEAPTEGVYAVYLLDTRTAADLTKLSKTVNGKPEVIRATSTTVASYATRKAAFGSAPQNEGAKTSAGAGVATAIAPGASAAPVVTGIKVEGAYVYITVKNTSPFLTYDVVGAEDVGDVDGAPKRDDVKQQAGAPNPDEEITFVVPKENSGKFFKVRRN